MEVLRWMRDQIDEISRGEATPEAFTQANAFLTVAIEFVRWTSPTPLPATPDESAIYESERSAARAKEGL